MDSKAEKDRGKELATKAIQARVESLLLKPNLSLDDLIEIEEHLLRTIEDPIMQTTLRLLLKVNRQVAIAIPSPSVAPEKRYTTAEAAEILGVSIDFLRKEVSANHIKTCDRTMPGEGEGKGKHGGRIYFLPCHLDTYSSKNA